MAPTSTSDTRRLAVVSINYMFMRFCDADTNQSQSLDADKFYAMQSPALKASYSRTNFDMWFKAVDLSPPHGTLTVIEFFHFCLATMAQQHGEKTLTDIFAKYDKTEPKESLNALSTGGGT